MWTSSVGVPRESDLKGAVDNTIVDRRNVIFFLIDEFNDLEQDFLKGLLKQCPAGTSFLIRLYSRWIKQIISIY